MVFKCQADSFLKEFTSNVLSCQKASVDLLVNGKKSKIDAFEVILEDTILFPEGGGQPSDEGFLNDVKVLHVYRKGDKAIHCVEKPFNVGDPVKQVVNWERRLDHMQQHSGQHLITAIFEKEFGFPTISWWLGEETSYIELDTPSVSEETIRKAEESVNNLIREGRKVTVKVYDENTPQEVFKDARSVRGLPEDHKGDIRVIEIEGVEGNMCCGTHVNNLIQLQVIKLLHCEKGKKKDKCNLHFLVGNRVIKRLQSCLEREQKLVTLLKNNPSQHVELVDKLQKNSKTLSKNLTNALKELASFEANELKSADPKPKYFSLHKKEAGPDFMNNFIREFGSTEVFLFLSTGDDKETGNIILYGDEKAISELGPQVCNLLEGKGAGKGNKFQAKVNNMSARGKAEKLIAEYYH